MKLFNTREPMPIKIGAHIGEPPKTDGKISKDMGGWELLHYLREFVPSGAVIDSGINIFMEELPSQTCSFGELLKNIGTVVDESGNRIHIHGHSQPIRYLYQIKHPRTNEVMDNVGSKCIEEFCGMTEITLLKSPEYLRTAFAAWVLDVTAVLDDYNKRAVENITEDAGNGRISIYQYLYLVKLGYSAKIPLPYAVMQVELMDRINYERALDYENNNRHAQAMNWFPYYAEFRNKRGYCPDKVLSAMDRKEQIDAIQKSKTPPTYYKYYSIYLAKELDKCARIIRKAMDEINKGGMYRRGMGSKEDREVIRRLQENYSLKFD